MAGNSFGQIFKITTAGESHGPANIVIIDGIPSGIELSLDDIQPELNRRKPGQSRLTTQRKESDIAEILSGVFEGKTTGTSLSIMIRNEDHRSKDYSEIKDILKKDCFKQIILSFEPVWYGEHLLTKEGFEKLQPLFINYQDQLTPND